MIPGGLQLQHVIFSLKTFAAAMLAYWIALRFGLTNPYWAAGTVYIIANPLSGAITSKALYRLLGTAIGAVMIVVLVPNLVDSRVLLSLAIALWCGLCLFIAMLDRSPRSYVFMLGGYTVALTGFSLVSDPGSSFDIAFSRVEEIAIGIICAAVIGRAIFPQHAGPVLAKRVEVWLENAAALTRDVLEGHGESDEARKARHKLAADAVGLRGFTTQVAYEGANGRALVERMQALQQRMVMVLPLLSEVEDILSALQQEDAGEHRLSSLVGRITTWLSSGDEDAIATADTLLQDIAKERQNLEQHPENWDDLLLLRLTRRLDDLVETWVDCRMLRADMATGETHRLKRELSARYRDALSLHTNYRKALVSALAIIVTILIGCAFWIYSGWSYASGAVQFAAILCSVLAMFDNATPALKKVLQLMLIALATATLYEFAIMPALDGFGSLVAAFGLFLIPCGVLLAVPACWLMGFQLSVNFIYMLTLGNQVSTDFPTFINASLGSVLGLILATMVMATMRALNAESGAPRLLRSGWQGVIEIASGSGQLDPERVTGRMLDRLGQIVPRLATLPKEVGIADNDILRDLRVGLSVIRLQQNKADLTAHDRQAVEDVLKEITDHYRAREEGRDTGRGKLRDALDTGLHRILPRSAEAECKVRDALVGLRSALCPREAPPVLMLSEERRSA